ncbi:MAG: hypothetical protein K0U78_06005 [Actinomycetia bacterium]|nr:hypothetical protein [Actinomycetes bacterium]
MSAEELRHWRGVKPVAAPTGAAITTRIRTTAEDELVLDRVAAHLGSLRREDMACRSRPVPLDPGLTVEKKRQEHRRRLNTRKKSLTAQSSSRWASAIISSNDDQYRLARECQYRHLCSLQKAIKTVEKRLAAPTADTLTVAQRKAAAKERKSAPRDKKPAKGYATQAERFQKLRRLQHLKAELAAVQESRSDGRVEVVEGGKRHAKKRHNLLEAGLTADQWRETWDASRYRIHAKGSPDEPFGNLTITVAPDGEVSVRLPAPLEPLANAPRGRYRLSGRAVFSHRGQEWLQRITGGNSVSYTITRRPGRGGRYLTAAWAIPALPYWIGQQSCDAGEDLYADGPVAGVDLNDGHLAVRRLDAHGNPVGAPERIDFDISGTAQRRDAQVRHAITQLINYAQRFAITTIAVEDLNFTDARATGRETMGRGERGKRFRRTVSGIPTAVFRNRLAAMTDRAGIALYAVNPAYSSIWGGQHWQSPYKNVTRHQAAATVIGRRAQGFRARRREGVTCPRPEDRGVRATNQAAPENQRVICDRQRPRTRGTKSRAPNPLTDDQQAGQPLPRQWPTMANHVSNGRRRGRKLWRAGGPGPTPPVRSRWC